MGGGNKLLDLRRRMTLQAIAMNPSEIVLSRMIRTDDGGGGYTEEPDNLPAQTFRIYLSSKTGTREREAVKEGGQVQINIIEMLCPWDADVKPNDEFEFDGRHFRVHKVMPVRLQDKIVSYQCELEEIS